MTNHVHLIIESANENLSDVIRDIKKFTAYKIIEAVKNEPESRREWVLHRFSYNASLRSTNSNYQVWTHENHSIEIFTKDFFIQKSNYIHQNPVRAGWVEKEEDYLYSSAGVFYNRPSKIELSFI